MGITKNDSTPACWIQQLGPGNRWAAECPTALGKVNVGRVGLPPRMSWRCRAQPMGRARPRPRFTSYEQVQRDDQDYDLLGGSKKNKTSESSFSQLRLLRPSLHHEKLQDARPVVNPQVARVWVLPPRPCFRTLNFTIMNLYEPPQSVRSSLRLLKSFAFFCSAQSSQPG